MNRDTVLDIATAPGRSAKTWKRGTTTWGEVCAWVNEPRDGGKDGPGYVLGRLSSPRRTKDTIESRCVLALDADTLTPATRDELLARVRALGRAAVVYSTHSSTPDAPRLRILLLASRPVTPDEYRLVVRYLIALLGRALFDKTCDEPERLMYMPTTAAEGEFYAEVMDGAPLGVDALLLDAALEDPGEAAEEPSLPVATLPVRPVPEDVVRQEVAWTLGKLDELAALRDGERIDWPGEPDGVGWDEGQGVLYSAGRLIQAANSGSSYTLDDAEANFREHAPASNGSYDRDHKWEDALKHTGDNPMPYEHPEDVFDRVAREPGQDDHAGGWRAVDLSSYLDGTHTPPRATLMCRTDGVGLLYPGMTHSIHGESESGKSMIVQWEVAVRLKAGEWVLYLDYEADPGSVVERLRLMGVSAEQMGRLVYVQPETDHGLTDGTRAAFEVLLSRAYALVVLDGVTEALAQAPAKVRSTGGLGGNDDITIWHDHLPRVIARRTGAAVVLVDHVAKGPDAGRFAIGGQAKMATMTGAAYLVRPRSPLGRDLVGEVDLYVAKDRHGYVRSKAGEFTKDRLQLVATAVVDGTDGQLVVTLRAPLAGPTGDDRLHTMMERVSDYLAKLPPDHPGASLNLVRQGVMGNSDLKDRALRCLVDLGYVSRTIKGQANLHHHVRPFISGLGAVEADK